MKLSLFAIRQELEPIGVLSSGFREQRKRRPAAPRYAFGTTVIRQTSRRSAMTSPCAAEDSLHGSEIDPVLVRDDWTHVQPSFGHRGRNRFGAAGLAALVALFMLIIIVCTADDIR